ncbi:hypothetical protein [Phytoactinopolyspora endophytica]|uniref:hypothetical protein n=1 Tax=Phytoactinopolyspora endophytica TaxID=1642495 RepID=UPI00101BFAE9|nr:hypothetical protein [Phytoactinopolyspora endophytica]
MTHSTTARYALVLIVTMALSAIGLQPAQIDTAAAQTAAFSDGFQDDNDAGWTRDSGTWDVVAGTGDNLVYEQSATGSGVGGTSMIDDPTWTPFHLSVQVKPLDLEAGGDAVRVLFRYTNLDNHYVVYLTPTSVQLRKRAGGNLTTIAQAPVSITNGADHWIDVEGRGDHFTIHVDKTLKISVHDGTHASGGIGLGTWQTAAHFDNVRVTNVVRMGVAQSNLGWWDNRPIEAQHDVLAAMDDSGINRVRLAFARDFRDEREGQWPAVKDQVCHAVNEEDLDVTLVIGLGGNEFYYPDGTAKAVRTNFADVFRISDLNPALFETALRGYLTELESAGCAISALIIGNELNWIGFNGDLPEFDPTQGKIYRNDDPATTGVNEETEWSDPAYEQIRVGIDKWGQAISRASQVADEVFGQNVVKVVTGGFADIPHGHVENKGASYLDPELFLQLLQGTHPNQSGSPDYIANADLIGTHVYPYRPYDLDLGTGYSTIRDHIVDVMDPVVDKIGTPKAFWIDEFGFRNKHDVDGDGDAEIVTETQRLQLFRWFMLALHDQEFEGIDWRNVYVYNFVQNEALSIYECVTPTDEYQCETGTLLRSGEIFRDHPY